MITDRVGAVDVSYNLIPPLSPHRRLPVSLARSGAPVRIPPCMIGFHWTGIRIPVWPVAMFFDDENENVR